MLTKLLFVLSLLYDVKGCSHNDEHTNRTKSLRQFPIEFWFGASTSAYQIEGAWNKGGKGIHIWDQFVHTTKENIQDGSTGDDAAKSYYLYKRDVEMLKELGVKTYRFSISWTRILPNGRPDWVNQEGVDYYNDLINELIKNDIIPFASMYHWDLPQIFNEQGGWLTENIVKWFEDYVRVLFQNFGDRVKHWLTVNEPQVHCYHGYEIGDQAPSYKSSGIEFYTCSRNMLLAHAAAYHIYKNEFTMQGGQIGLPLNFDYGCPIDDSETSIEAVLDYNAFYLGIYMDPVFTEKGNYPQRLIDRVANKSAAQGYPESRLRPFSKDQVNFLRKTADFLAINTYTRTVIYRNESLIGKFREPSFDDDVFVGLNTNPSKVSYSYSDAMYALLIYMKETYNNPTIYITENGFSSSAGLNDDERIKYINEYLQGVLDGMADGVNVKGYSVWCLMDAFEWSMGYTSKMGLYELDLNDPMRRRIPRKSALAYSNITRSRMIDTFYNPDLFT